MKTTTLADPKPDTAKVQLTFEYLGTLRVLNKHPRVQTQLNQGAITPEAARATPWYIRLTVAGGSRTPFNLGVDDAKAIREAKKHIDANGTTAFTEFLEQRAAKRSLNLGELAAEWLTLNLPDAAQRPRDDEARDNLQPIITSALRYWAKLTPATVTTSTMNHFATWRRNDCKEKKRGTGDRSIDKELSALSSLCDWAVSVGHIEKNPFATRPQYQRTEDVSHCHEFSPDSDEQWHSVLRHCFTHEYHTTVKPALATKFAQQDALYTLRLRIIGGWLAFTGLTGIRPEEPQFLFRFAKLKEVPPSPFKLLPGTIFPTRDGQTKMRVQRGKAGQNPFVTIHPALADFLAHWTAWLDSNLSAKDSQIARPLFPDPQKPSTCLFSPDDFTPLVRRLTDACDAVHIQRLKPKGFGRAYYVRVRRSQGADDSVIAGELGQTTNGKLIRDTYGNPEDMAGGALFDWLPEEKGKPTKPAWQLLTVETASNVITL